MFRLLVTLWRRTGSDHEVMNTLELQFDTIDQRALAKEAICEGYDRQGFWVTLVEY